MVDALQTGDGKGVTTPIDWVPGGDVIVPPTVGTEDARRKFGDVRVVRPEVFFPKPPFIGEKLANIWECRYLRFTNVGK